MKNSIKYQLHPWHGLSLGENAPQIINCYVEIVPTDTIKYELDKVTGILKVDRPQKYSSLCPSLYGFVPQTYCGDQVAKYCEIKTQKKNLVGDGDPLDICVLTEHTIPHGDIIVRAIPIGGFRLLDGEEVDDKIIAVMVDDLIYGGIKSLNQCPDGLIDRLRHYFLTYKAAPGKNIAQIVITHTYDQEEAYEVIRRATIDYQELIKENHG